jgi:SUMO ligase MMS21 Smc5/6 complex component
MNVSWSVYLKKRYAMKKEKGECRSCSEPTCAWSAVFCVHHLIRHRIYERQRALKQRRAQDRILP